MRTCDNCGSEYDDDYSWYDENNTVLCQDCVITCPDCGSVVPKKEAFEVDGTYYCESCIVICHQCGDVVREVDSVTVTDVRWSGYRRIRDEVVLCDGCYDDYSYRCDDCCGRFLGDPEMSDGNRELCSDCSENYYRCEDCGDLIHCDDIYTSANEVYCRDCYRDHERENDEDEIPLVSSCSCDKLKDYSDKPTPKFKNCSGCRVSPMFTNDLFIGMELEVVSRVTPKNLVMDHIHDEFNTSEEDELFYFKRDGSIGTNGFEIVSHPMTPDFVKKNNIFERLSKILVADKCISHNYQPKDDESCGLHFHVNKSFFGWEKRPVSMIAAWIYSNYSGILQISRRTEESFEHWAGAAQYVYEDNSCSEYYNDYNRHVALNIRNENTIEFRFFRGSTRSDRLTQSFNTIVEICESARDMTWNEFRLLNPVEIYTRYEGVSEECASSYISLEA